MAVHDADEAVQYFTAALQSSPDDPLLLEGLGRAYQARAQLDEAAAAWERASSVADGPLRSSLHYRIALLEAERGNATPDLEYAADDPDAATLKMIFTQRRTHTGSGKEIVAEMLAFAADPSPAGQAVASSGLAIQAITEHDLTRAREAALRSVSYAQRCMDVSPIQISSARRLMVWISLATGDVPAAIEHAVAWRRDVGQFDVPSARCSLQFAMAAAYYLRGDLHTALREASDGERTARTGKMHRSLTRLLLLRSILLAEQGRIAEAEACRAEAENTWIPRDVSVSTMANLSDMIILIHSGQIENLGVIPEWVSYNEPLSVLQPLFAGMIYLATKDEDKLTETIANFRGFGDTAPFFTAVADRLTGLHTSSPRLLAQAAALFERCGARLLAAQTQLEWAELTGDRNVTVTLFDENDAIPWSSRARRHARSVGVRIPAARTSGVLTNRESQVVRLLGDGLSNADIAARLFLSERTVETHLRNSYAKLHLTSRVALARWAAENGDRE
jgi:DNA-binding CsgD family transcriptional regulator/tetratricopeptide (TPR) repeat protein